MVRLTGGEPLLRDDLEEIVGRVAELAGIREVALTTNARELASRARMLRDAGLRRVNIGLPSLSPETYRRMTGGELAPALSGIEAALDAGLAPVKLNVVVIGGANSGELAGFVGLARTRPVEVRFIERMPFAGADGLVTAGEIRARLAASLGAGALEASGFSPTAEVFQPAGFAGRIGIIAPVTEPFCSRCDRLRVTSDGRLRACLSEPGDVDILGMLREGAGPSALAAAFREAFARKPARHAASFAGHMRGIGG